MTRKFPDDECERDVVGNTLTVQSIILQRYPELLKSPDTTESLYSDRNSSYDNVERRMERNHTPESRIERTDDPSEWETMLDTDESDVERIKRNTSFKERLDPLLCEFFIHSFIHPKNPLFYLAFERSNVIIAKKSIFSEQRQLISAPIQISKHVVFAHI